MKFVLNLLFLIATSSVMAQSVIRFQPAITAQARLVGDLLLISHDSQGLAQIPLDKKPKSGSLLSKKQIMTWLVTKKGAISYTWRGKKTARVSEHSHASGKALVIKAQQALTNELNKQHYTRLVISPKTHLSHTELPRSAFTLAVAPTIPPAKRVCVHLKYQKKTIPVWFSVQAYQKVLVANEQLKMNSLINATDFSAQERNIAGLKGVPLSQLPSPQWLKQSLKAGQILQAQQTAAMPDVVKGQQLTIRINKGGILITLEVNALAHGYIGQVIKMTNPQTNKSLKARILSTNEAEIVA